MDTLCRVCGERFDDEGSLWFDERHYYCSQRCAMRARQGWYGPDRSTR